MSGNGSTRDNYPAMSLQSPENRFLRLTTREQSRTLDEQTIHSFGLSGTLLMEIAGLKAAEYIRAQTGRQKNGLYVCGKGNNAGDALVAARYLVEEAHHSVHIQMVTGDKDLSPDAAANLELLQKLKKEGAPVSVSSSSRVSSSGEYHYAVDGMIGTGLSTELRPPLTEAVHELNQSGLYTYSMDIPTGLHCDTGQILGTCVQADQTITFGTNKIGFYLGSGPRVTGKISLAELPFPGFLRRHEAVLINEELTRELSAENIQARHKYEKGTVHIVAGSSGMTGAAIMAARSAWNAGAGAVFLYAPKGLLQIYEQTLPQIIKVPVGDSDDIHFKPDHVDTILDKISDKQGPLLAGPGIGNTKEARKALTEVLLHTKAPVILDADGLAAWNECTSVNKNGWILTPHPGELQNYLGISADTDHGRLSDLRKVTAETGCHVVSKGNPTLFSAADGMIYITEYDTRIFARAGFGDVLAGTIAGKLAVTRQAEPAIVGAFIQTFKAIQHIPDPEPGDIYDR